MRRFTPTLALAALLALVGCDDEKKPTPPPASGAGSTKVAPTPGAAQAPTEAEAETQNEYGGEFCATIIPCFTKFEFVGNFVAEVGVDIEPDGSVSSVSFSGQAPKPVQSCITEEIEKIELAEYNGKPGHTTCTKSGQLMGGGQMVMSDWSYTVREPGEAQGEAAAAEGEAAAEAEGIEAAAEADAKKDEGAEAN